MAGSAQSSAAPRFCWCFSFDPITREPRLDGPGHWIIGGHAGRHGRGSMTLCLKSDPSKPSYMDKHCMSTEKAHGPLWRSHEHQYGKWISKKSRSHSPSIVSLPAKQLYLAVAGKPTQLPWVRLKSIYIYIYTISVSSSDGLAGLIHRHR